MTDSANKAKEIMDPILDLMGGADGGVGYAKLLHSVLPALITLSEEGDSRASKLIYSIKLFSEICKTTLG
ncbi:hypothetical protein SCBWM1_gp57 [Synechococcus phage S-CBWM1]|uniref:Uncharacterized protein n=1 Tax=Synechococcus phage S-CBWM1 TaxID=2053653 RepID=A0A3G1L3I2_9CAUD|nr:hypothetical protein HOU61_gp140 [Synechococcus phage S-CBWM1]ATW62741.1 hypothetical protein SCBWM1_gp57 [Synechococcus phage S-CBWM1]